MRFIFNLIPIGIILAMISLAFGWEWAVAAVVVFFTAVTVGVMRNNESA